MLLQVFAYARELVYNSRMKFYTQGGRAAAYGDFAALYDLLMQDVPYDSWAAYLLGLLRANGLPAESPLVLDCACGTGAFSIRMQEAGCRVVASDCSPDMLRVAQGKAMSRGLRIPFVRQDMRALCTHTPADAVCACCDGVNYLTSPGDTAAFFAAAHAALKPGGLLAFDLSSAFKLEHVLGGHTFGEDTDKCAYLWRNAFDPESRLLEMRLTFFVPDGSGAYRRFCETHVQRAHASEEIGAMLADAGFVVIGAYNAFTTEPAGPEAERIQWIARKLGL